MAAASYSQLDLSCMLRVLAVAPSPDAGFILESMARGPCQAMTFHAPAILPELSRPVDLLCC